MANNVAAEVLVSAISNQIQHLIDPKEPAKSMYDKLKAGVAEQSSGSSANFVRIELVYKKFEDTPTMETYHERLTFNRSNNAALDTVGAGFDDSFLAWRLLISFDSNDDPVWSVPISLPLTHPSTSGSLTTLPETA